MPVVSLQGNLHDVQVITHHKDVWTYEGAIMTIPILGTLYLDVSASIVLHKACREAGMLTIYFARKMGDSTLLWYAVP